VRPARGTCSGSWFLTRHRPLQSLDWPRGWSGWLVVAQIMDTWAQAGTARRGGECVEAGYRARTSHNVPQRHPAKLVGLTKVPIIHTYYVHIIGTCFIFRNKGGMACVMALHEFRNTLKAAVEKVIQDHEPYG